MAHTCRGTINLAGACIDTVDSTHFVVTNGASQVTAGLYMYGRVCTGACVCNVRNGSL